MLRRIDRVIVRVPNVASAVRYYRDVLGLAVVKEEKRLASLRFAEGEAELVVHDDADLPAEAVYFLVDDVRALFARREELALQFIQAPTAAARGYRAAIRDPFGNVMLIVDRTADVSGAVEDGKSPGALFAGVEEERLAVKEDLLSRTYQEIGRTADDLPYTPDFERLFAIYAARHAEGKPTRREVWRHLLNLRKAGKLPKLGEARSRPPAVEEEDRERLRVLLGEEIGKRDRLPYTERFEKMVDVFNRGRGRPLSPHLVWRLVATLAK